MPEFRINLIRDRTPSPRQRRAHYRAMILYLAVAGAALAAAVGVSTVWLTRAADARADIARLDQQFAGSHPAKPGMMAHAAWLEQEMTARLGPLQFVDRQLAGRPQPARLIYRLVLSLPPDVTLRSLTFGQTGDAVAFELLVPSSRTEAGLGPSDLIALWNQDTDLGGCVSRIAYEGSQRQSNGGRSDIVWRFAGRLARRES